MISNFNLLYPVYILEMSISTVDKCVLTYGRVMSTSMILDAEIFLRMHQTQYGVVLSLKSVCK